MSPQPGAGHKGGTGLLKSRRLLEKCLEPRGQFPWVALQSGLTCRPLHRLPTPPRPPLGGVHQKQHGATFFYLAQGLTPRGFGDCLKLAREKPTDTLFGLWPLEVHRRASSREGKVVREHFLEKCAYPSALA